MEVSAGVLIKNKRGQFLGCKPFGRAGDRPQNYLDIPKGRIEEGESPETAAKRETQEETGIYLDSVRLKNLGRHPYIKGKDLHLFSCDFDVNLTDLQCTSYFEIFDKKFPEVIEYEWVDPEDVNKKFFKSLIPIISNFV